VKKQSMLFAILLSVVLISVLAVSGCGKSQSAGAEYVVGFVNHLTGPGAVYGVSCQKGVELAVKQINDAGGIKGKPVRVIYEDDKMDAPTAITALRTLIDVDKVPVVLGSGSSTVTLAILPVAKQAGIVQISAISTSPELRNYAGTYFGVMPTDEEQGAKWVEVAQQMNYSKVALMYINNDYGIGVRDAFTKAFTAAGGSILISEPFAEGGTDFRTELLKVKATNPPVVFIVDHVVEGSIVLKQARQLGLDVPFIGDVAMQTDDFITQAGASAAEGFMALREGSPNTPQYQKFAQDFQAMFNEPPTIWSDFAYDSVMLVAKAIETNGYSASGIRDGLLAIKDYPGASGSISFDSDGIRVHGGYSVMKVENGKFVLSQ